MYKLTLEWTQGTQNCSQTISTEQQTLMPGVIRIGRDSQQCDVVVEDPTNQISRLHAEIFFHKDLNTLCLRNATWNQGQTNVVLLDGKLVIEEEVPLQAGSMIQLRNILLKVDILEIEEPTYTSVHQSPQLQQNQFTQPVIPNQSPETASKGNIKLGSSILQKASQDDFDAIATMFRQFIPQDEQIHCARFLGIQGLWGFGTREFACVTDRRVANITVGYFGEVTYEDGYLEHINSGIIYQPSKLGLYLLIGIYLFFGWSFFFPVLNLFLPLLDFVSLGLTTPLSAILRLTLSLLSLPLCIKLYYRIFKCGLVLTVRESEAYLTVMGTYAFTERLIYIFTNRKLITRANALYRSFIIQREARLDVVEKYPLSNQ